MRRIFITLAKLTIAILILWFLAQSSKLNFKLLVELFYSPAWLLPAILLYFVVVFVSAWRWFQLNTKQNIPISFKETLIPTYLGIAFNNLLPGGVGGDFFRGYFLFKKIPDNRSGVMLSILFDRITGLMGVFIAVTLVTLMHFKFFNSQRTTFYFVMFCLLSCASGIILYLVLSFFPKKINFGKLLSKHFQHKKYLNTLLALLNAVNIYRHSKIAIAKCLIASVGIQVLIAATCFLFAEIMHFPPIYFFDFIIAIGITQIVSLIPITPGGFGIGEAAFANVLILLNPGINASYASIYLAYRLIGILVYLPGLAVFLFDNKLSKQSRFLSSTESV